MEPLVLTVDLGGLPQAWVDLEEAITYHAKQIVAWSTGGVVREFRGGLAAGRDALASVHQVHPRDQGQRRPAAVARPRAHQSDAVRARSASLCLLRHAPPVARLSRDHVVPASRGGRDSWTNSVTACRSCNTRKGNRSPEQADMPLLYVPYVPNRHEHFILRNRRILADQMEYLLAGVPKTSRLRVGNE
jgi:5-methylcytosine-specific restriction endonuclease McrA